MKHAIREFKIWTICLLVGTTVLATEVAVKARRPTIQFHHLPAPRELAPAASVAPVAVPAPDLTGEIVAQLLVDSVIQIESAGQPRTVGSKGERGLMQIKEETWRDTTRRLFGRATPFNRAFDPDLNRQVGTAYLSWLHDYLQTHRDQWQSDERALLLACYNAGPGRVAAAQFNIRRLPASTRDYVERASALHDLYLEENELQVKRDSARRVVEIVHSPRQRDS